MISSRITHSLTIRDSVLWKMTWVQVSAPYYMYGSRTTQSIFLGERVDLHTSPYRFFSGLSSGIFSGLPFYSTLFISHHKWIIPSLNIPNPNYSTEKQKHFSFCPENLAALLESPHPRMKLIIYSLLHCPFCTVFVSGSIVQ